MYAEALNPQTGLGQIHAILAHIDCNEKYTNILIIFQPYLYHLILACAPCVIVVWEYNIIQTTPCVACVLARHASIVLHDQYY